MGCAQSGLTDAQKAAISESSKLDQALKDQQSDEGKVFKLLLLGTGESGKSTIFKQMQILYQEGFTELEKATFKHVIRRNVVEAMQTLINGAERFNYSWHSQEAEEGARFLLEVDPLTADFWQAEIIDHVIKLWTDEKAIKKTYAKRSRLQLLDSSEYLFTNVKRIGKPDYVPTPDDILRARLRTSGIVERMFKIEGVDFRFLDVGGQRNERRKWIHCFDEVTALIFVAAISEYDQVLYEDEKKNRLAESIDVFANICNNRYFANSVFILFLNKMDLFEDKIKRVPLKDFFPDYNGEDALAPAARHIEAQFLAANKSGRTIFPHLTCATDTKNVERVFDAAKRAILKQNINDMGELSLM